MSTFNEGNTKYRLQKLPVSRQYIVTSETFLPGQLTPVIHTHKFYDQYQGDEEALREGVIKLRPIVARAEAKHRGEDISLPADPAIDAAIAREAKLKRQREEAEAEAIAIREAAGQFLNEQNPMWGMF